MDNQKAPPRTRLAAFSSRAKGAPDNVYTHVVHGWRYIPVHPFADDRAVLEQFDVSPEQCLSVDAYWEYAGDVHLVQVDAAEVANRGRGKYYRWSGGVGYATNLVAVLDSGPIVRAAFELVLTELAPSMSSLGRASKLTIIAI